MNGHVLVIDQGTTSTRAIGFAPGLEVVSQPQTECPQYYPQPGWVEHDPENLLANHPVDGARGDCGIARWRNRQHRHHQRETTLVWDCATGHPVANATVWQDLERWLRAKRLKPQATARW